MIILRETLDRGSILNHVTDCEDLSIEPSILIEYVETTLTYALNEIQFR